MKKRFTRILGIWLTGIILLIPSYGSAQTIDFSSPSSGCTSFGNISFDTGRVVFQTGGDIYRTTLSCEISLLQGESLEFRYLFENTEPDEILSPYFQSYFQDSFQMEANAGGGGYFIHLLADQDTEGFENFEWRPDSIIPNGPITLTFSLLDEDDEQQSRAVLKDFIVTYHPVPEPETLLLLGVGMLILMLSLIGRIMGQRQSVWILTLILCQTVPFSKDVLGAVPEKNVDSQVSVFFTSPLLDSRTSILTGFMSVKNISDQILYGPLWYVITGISDPSVVLTNGAGVTQDGKPYFDLSSLIPDGTLEPGESTPPVKMAFHNPKRLRFRWDQDILAREDVLLPDDSEMKGPVIDNVCIRPGESPAVCEFDVDDFETANPEFDTLGKKVLPEMYSQSRIRVFTYDDVYDVEDLRITVQGQTARMDSEGAFYADLLLNEGRNEVLIESRNPSGVSAVKTLILTIDTHFPEISIIAPEPNQVITDPVGIVEGTVDDPEVDFVRVITLSGDLQVPLVQMRFSAAVELGFGPNPIRAEVRDRAGNTNSIEVQILRVRTAVGLLHGQILSAPVGAPMSGAVIRISTLWKNPEDLVASTTSEINGHYALSDVPSGMLRIRVTKEGYQPREMDLLFLGGDDPESRNIALTPSQTTNTALLTGVVKDRSGQPLSDVLISITGRSHDALTGTDGLYLIQDIPRESFWVNAEKTGFYPMSHPLMDFDPAVPIVTQSFILDKAPEPIVIRRPAPGEILQKRSTVVLGELRSELAAPEHEIDVRVNGVPAVLYENHFVVNHLPLTAGSNQITVEIQSSSGFLWTATERVEVVPTDKEGRLQAEWEEGTPPLPLILSMEPAVPAGTSRVKIEGPAPVEYSGEGGKYEGLIVTPGIYLVTIIHEQGGETFEDEVAVTVFGKEDLELHLLEKWDAIASSLLKGDVESALTYFTPEAAFRYREFMSDIPQYLSPFFSDLEEIQLIEMRGGIAQARLERDGLTYYLWFVRDVDGTYKLHRF